MKKNYFLGVLNAAVNDGFEFDMTDSMEDVVMQAEEYLFENEPYGHVFENVGMNGHGMSQNYCWVDDESDHTIQMSGEIFDFADYKAEQDIYFRLEENGDFTHVNWFEIPNEFEKEERKKYVYVFDKQVKANGKIAWLYDYMG